MTINHIYLLTPARSFTTMRSFYLRALAPIGYRELLRPSPTFSGLGNDFPYLWLKALPEGPEGMDSLTLMPTHLAFDAPNNAAVDEFHKSAIEAGGKDNGGPGIREQMSEQPYYSAYVIDPLGNNLEVVCVPKASFKASK